MNEVHFSGLTSQSNIYGLASLTRADGLNKMLVASRKRKVYCVEYSKNDTSVIPSTREVQFTYIPGGAEIISIDAFNKSAQNHDFLVGITFVKLGETSDEAGKYFNIYSEWEAVGECDLDNIAQGCFTLNLDFMPYQLTHDKVIVEGNKEIVWLLSGGDCKVHVYKEDKAHQCFCEIESSMYPEFENLPGIINWMDFFHLEEMRLTAFGTQEGYVQVSIVSTSSTTTKVESSWSLQHDSCISCVRLFVDFTEISPPKFLESYPGEYKDGNNRNASSKLKVHLVVGSALELCVVYMDVLENGLSDQYPLPSSNCFDVVTSVCVADVDMDGFNEILVGTYGQELIAYKWINNEYFFQWNHSFAHPILSIAYMDIIGDGMQEILVLSTKGLHVMQHDLQRTAELCVQRMQSFLRKMTLFADNEKMVTEK